MDGNDSVDSTDIIRRMVNAAKLTLGDMRNETEDDILLSLMEQGCEETLRQLDLIDSWDEDDAVLIENALLNAFIAGAAWGRVSHRSDLNDTLIDISQMRDRLIERRRRTMR